MIKVNLHRVVYFTAFLLICCGQAQPPGGKLLHSSAPKEIINATGKTVETRFNTPEGFVRKSCDKNSFAWYLRNLPLKPVGSKVKYYNGNIKGNMVYDAVVDQQIGNTDLQQCADAVMRLRAEYFFAQKAYDKISFTLTNGFTVDYIKWTQGYRIVVSGNKISWKLMASPSNTYADFLKYMDLIFNYAGTLSLSKSLKTKNFKDIAIGDVLIKGGSPGHAVIVVDVAENIKGEKMFILAQSYMPAQETQILKNFNDENISPWYRADFKGKLETPEWDFTIDQLKTW